MYTLNKLDIPTPYQGEPYDSIKKIILTKELLGPDVDKAELKVIGFIEGQMPSLVATQTYKLREDKQLISHDKDAHQNIERIRFELPNEQNDELIIPGANINAGTSSVNSSPDIDGMNWENNF